LTLAVSPRFGGVLARSFERLWFAFNYWLSSPLRGARKIESVEKTKIMLDGERKFLIDRLRPAFYNFIFTFPESAINYSSLDRYLG
jgi:hypothetical protein